MSSPGAGLAFNHYRSRTVNCKKRSIPHAAGGQVERGLAAKDPSKNILINILVIELR